MAYFTGQWSDLDWVDRANSFWSVLLLSVLSVGVFLLRFLIDPFVCWTPMEFSNDHVTFVQQYVSMVSKMRPLGSQSDVQQSAQSQHLAAPLILFLQALGFVAPYLLWRLARPLLALPLPILESQTAASQVPSAARLLLASLRRGRTSLTYGYLVVRGLACLNLLIQFVMLSVFFNSQLAVLGPADTPVTRFPTMVLANVTTRKLMTDQEWSFSCLSPMNDVLLRLFVFLWYWILFLGCLTLTHTLLTAATLFLPTLRDGQLEVFLHSGEEGGPNPGDVSKWVRGTLGTDGVLLLKQVSACQGSVMASVLAREMWRLESPLFPPPQPTTQPLAPPTHVQDIPLTVLPVSAEGADDDAGMAKVPL